MVKSAFGLIIVAAAVMAAAPTVRTMYNDAVAWEQNARAAMAADDSAASALKTVHAAIARYESVVRRYPRSSYCDNALWQAAQLSLDAFTKFGQPADKETGTRLLKQLASMYPTSKLAAQVPSQLARMTSDTPVVPRVPESPRPSVTNAPPLPVARAADKAERADKPEKSESVTPANLATIKEIRRTVLTDAVRIVIELDTEVEFHQDRIDGPPRVFVDLPGTRAAAALVDRTLRFDSDADVVRQVRIGRHPNSTTRVVLDAVGVSSYSVYPLYAPYRLVIDCVRASGVTATSGVSTPAPTATSPLKAPVAPPPMTTSARVAAAESTSVPAVVHETARLPSHPVPADWLRSLPGHSPQSGLLIAEALAPAPEVPAPSPIAVPAAKPTESAAKTVESSKPADPAAAPPAKNGNGGFSIARQLGLGVSRIVIDAGHGGHDPGARARGIVEAELVLDVALRVEKLLQKSPGVEVVLTRRADEFIALQERTAVANREGADLFLSIHANASANSQAHGIETYFLNFASNLSAASVAARENAASGQAMNALPDIVKAIALNNKLDESRDFAAYVQRAMIEHLRGANKGIKDLGVKQAPFVVLIGAAMPSVLAEISFVTNPQEARLLKNGNYRQRIAEALVAAIRKYQASLKSTTNAAQ
jgi:N-acetylmuramoyl-L-alanine amidase